MSEKTEIEAIVEKTIRALKRYKTSVKLSDSQGIKEYTLEMCDILNEIVDELSVYT